MAALLVTGLFAAADVMLVRLVHRHRAETALQVFERAVGAREQRRVQEALELFRRALNESPSNPAYRLAFAEALRAAGRVEEARVALERLLDAHPAHGGANAELARILAEQGDWKNAAWYYRRALYGEWKDDSELRKLRFDLASLLAKHGAREELLAELLLLTATPLDAPESRRVGQLFLAAEDWNRAEREYRELLRDAPQDPNLLTGLARAEAGQGRYLAAERTYRRAVRAGAGASAEAELKLLSAVNVLDPTIRGLGAQEKHRRAHELTALMTDVIRECVPDHPSVAEADTVLAHRQVRSRGAAADQDLELFEALWQAHRDACLSAVLPRELQMLGEQLVR